MTCEVSVLYFAKSSELAGVRKETLTVSQEITTRQLWDQIVHSHPSLHAIQDQVLLAVRQEYVAIGDELLTLNTGDEIAVIPPISGAEMDEDVEEPKDFIKITHNRLSTDEASQLVTSPTCGAVSLFIGTTRNTFEGKKVVRLEYESYIPMAEMEIKKIFVDVRQQWPHVKHLAVHHRLGLVPVSEASVVIAVSSPHRSDSLDAVKYCINRLKATVPIWKKEIYEEESYSWKENKECFWKNQDEV